MKKLMFLVSLLSLVALGCIPSLAPPVIVALEANPSEITAGESATLLWNVTGATSITIDQGIGVVGAAGTKVISPSTTTAYTLTATNTAGTVSKSVVVNVTVVSPPPPTPTPTPTPLPAGLPVIVDFSATPVEITVGGLVTLTWNVTGATSVSIDQGIGNVPAAGTGLVSPATTTVYTLTATNAAGSTFESVMVTVVAGPPPPPADTTPPTVPVLLSPANGATLPQPGTPWTFDWADSSDPESGVSQYQLYVIRQGAGSPVIDILVMTSAGSKNLGGQITHDYLTNWTWKVRAQNNVGLWSAWSEQRTFNVEPKVVTTTLFSLDAEDGHVKEGGGTNPYPNVGDDSANKALQAFLSFDISGIPSDSVITSASLDLSTGDMLGDPFAGLGWMRVYNHQYGSLDSGDFTPGFPTGAMYTYASRPMAPFTSSTLISQLQARVTAGSSRFQVRVQFQNHTDSDNAVDALRFGETKLVISYEL